MNLSRFHALLVVSILSLISKADAYGMGIDLNIRSQGKANSILAENVLTREENVFRTFDKKSFSRAVYFVINAGSVANKKYYSSLIGAMFQHGIYRHATINEIIDGCFDVSEGHGERRNLIPIRRKHGHPLFSFVKESAPHTFCAKFLCVPVKNWRKFSFLPITTNGNDGISQRNNVYGWNISEIFCLGRKYIGNSASFIHVGVRGDSLNNSNPWPLLGEVGGASCNQRLPRQISLVSSNNSVAKDNNSSNTNSDSVYAFIAWWLFVSGFVTFAKGACYAVAKSGDDVPFFRYAITAGSMIIGGLIIGSIGGVLFLIIVFPVH